MDVLELLRHWDQVRKGLDRALDMVQDDHLGFVPCVGLWSLGTVLRHIANAEDSWFRVAAADNVMVWPAGRFADADYTTVASIKELLAQVHARTHAILEGADAKRLQRAIELPWKATVTVPWIAWHVLEHEIHHRGEVYLMLGMLGMEAPDV